MSCCNTGSFNVGGVPLVDCDGMVHQAMARVPSCNGMYQAIADAISGSPGAGQGAGSIIGGININQNTPSVGANPNDHHYVISDTNALGNNNSSGRMVFETEFYFDGVLANNGRLAIILRQDPAVVTTFIRGQGAILGDLTGTTNASLVQPTVQAFSSAGGLPSGVSQFLFPNSGTIDPVTDGVRYRISVESTVDRMLNRYIRYTLHKLILSTNAWELVNDTGDMLDANKDFDSTKTGLVVAIIGVTPGTWSASFNNARVSWYPTLEHVTDASKVSTIVANAVANITPIDGESVLAYYTAYHRVEFTPFGAPLRNITRVPFDVVNTCSFGTFSADKKSFTFTKAGSYAISVSVPMGVLALNYAGAVPSSTIVTGQMSCILNMGTFQSFTGTSRFLWANRTLAQDASLNNTPWQGTTATETLVDPNITVGRTIALDFLFDTMAFPPTEVVNPGSNDAYAIVGLPAFDEVGGTVFNGIQITRLRDPA